MPETGDITTKTSAGANRNFESRPDYRVRPRVPGRPGQPTADRIPTNG